MRTKRAALLGCCLIFGLFGCGAANDSAPSRTIGGTPVQGVLQQVSVSSSGQEGNSHSSTPVIDASGRYVAFQSLASNLVDNDSNGAADIFLRDTCNGVSSCTASTQRVSLAPDGSESTPSTHSFDPSMSANGRYIAFSSASPNFTANKVGTGADIYLRDTCIGATGCTPTTTRISENALREGGDNSSMLTSMNSTGRYVAFATDATNLVPNDGNSTRDILVADTCIGASGCVPSLTRVSVATDGSEANGLSQYSSISASGRYVAFDSDANNLVAGDTNGTRDIFLHDTCVGVSGCSPSTIRVSVSTGGQEANGSSVEPSVSADGRFVAFQSSATNLVSGDNNATDDVFVRDTCIGASGCTPTTIRVSVSVSGGDADAFSASPRITTDGRFVAFRSMAANLVNGDSNGAEDTFVRDLCTGVSGCTPITIRASVSQAGGQGNLGTVNNPGSVAITPDGKFVVFASRDTNLISPPSDINDSFDVFLAATALH